VARNRVTFSVEAVPWDTRLVAAPVWRFGDGRSATGVRVRHVYRKPGRYSVTVTAADSSGQTTTATAAITIRRRPRR
jgi:PKD repeat protein